jgi:hypothetical protein
MPPTGAYSAARINRRPTTQRDANGLVDDLAGDALLDGFSSMSSPG